MKFAAIIAATLATANAVKQNYTMNNMGDATTSEGNMQETVTDITYQIVDLDQVQSEIERWYSDTASPFISDHKDMVYKAALAEMEAEHGALLETCDEGTACRERYMAELREKISSIWKQTLTNFKQTIESAVTETRAEVDARWVDLQECQTNHPCCSISEIFWMNNVKKVKQVRAEYSRFVMKWFEFDLRRIEIESICPISINYECAAMGSCWDGSLRDVTHDCECPAHRPPACPDTPCRNGQETREPNTCECIMQFPSNAFNVYTEYVSEPADSIIITWEDLNGQLELEGYYVYLNHHRAQCNESQDLINQNMKCTVPLGDITRTPFDFNYGDLVQAQIADVYDGMEETELSQLGGTAMIPELDVIVEFQPSWQMSYQQIQPPAIADGTFEHTDFEVHFDNIYIGESTIVGRGDDDYGQFFIMGHRSGEVISFIKRYTNTELYPYGNYMIYEGQISNDNEITGEWQRYVNDERLVYTSKGVSYDQFGQDPYHDTFTMHLIYEEI